MSDNKIEFPADFPPDHRLKGKVSLRKVEPKSNGHGNTSPRFKLIKIRDLYITQEPVWLVDGLLPTGPALGVIFGRPKSGKTFLATTMLYHVTLGRPFCGRAVQKGAVVYVTNEGVRGFHRRIMAMQGYLKPEGADAPADAPFYIVNTMPNMGTKSGDAELLAMTIRSVVPNETVIAAVVIDTLRRAMSGKSENVVEDMSMFIDNCTAISEALACLSVAIHHSPRSDDTRTSGSNSLDAGGDVLISVIKDKATGISTVNIEEMKDGETGLSWQFKVLKFDFLDRNQNHGCAGVCATVSNPAREPEGATKAQPKLTAVEQRLHTIICDAITDHGVAVPGSPDIPFGTKAVTRLELAKYADGKGFYDAKTPNAFRAYLSKYITQLAGKSVVGTTKEHVWLPKP